MPEGRRGGGLREGYGEGDLALRANLWSDLNRPQLENGKS